MNVLQLFHMKDSIILCAMTKRMLVGDIAVVVLILVLCSVLPFLFWGKTESSIAIVTVDAEVTHEIPLDENTTFSPDGGHTYVTVSEGFAYISSSDCPDGLCMKMKKADKNGGSVVCLPNRVSVSVKINDKAGGADVEVG